MEAVQTSTRTLDIVCSGGLTIDTIFRVSRLPKAFFEGEILEYHEHFGGRAPNVAYIAARLGLRSSVVSPVGMDFGISGYRRHLEAAGVDLSSIADVPGAPLTRIFLFADPGGRHITFFYLGASEFFAKMPVPEILLSGAKVLHVSSSGDRHFNMRIAARAMASGCDISFDTGNDPAIEDPRYVRKMVAMSRWLSVNREELKWVFRATGVTSLSRLLHKGPRSVAIISKRQGTATVVTDDAVVRMHLPNFTPVDLTGASDGFVAGYLASQLKGMDARTSVKIGLAVMFHVARVWGSQTAAPNWDTAVRTASRLFPARLSSGTRETSTRPRGRTRTSRRRRASS